MSLLEIHKEFQDEYHNLSKEEKEELIKEFSEEKENLKGVQRPSSKACQLDVANVARNIEMLVSKASHSVFKSFTQIFH